MECLAFNQLQFNILLTLHTKKILYKFTSIMHYLSTHYCFDLVHITAQIERRRRKVTPFKILVQL